MIARTLLSTLACWLCIDCYALAQPSTAEISSEGLALYRPGSVQVQSSPKESFDWIFRDDLTISVWVRADQQANVSSDLLSWTDDQHRFSGHLTLKTDTGVTSCQPHWRNLQFGIDDGSPSRWQDCGAPGQALFAFSMAVHQGQLYAGTCEPAKGASGKVYRYSGEQNWQLCGKLDDSNSVTSLAVYNDQLYAGTGKYRVAGSSLPESDNQELGGRVYRYKANDSWELVGQLPNVEAVGGLVVYRDQLYASSLYKPAGFFRLDGDYWTTLPAPQIFNSQSGKLEEMRVESLTVHDDSIYASSYDGGRVFRFDGTAWEDRGQIGENTQTYGFVRYQGRLLVSTWPSGRVFQLEESGLWSDFGRLGEELEVMGMMVHNGRLMAGTLPSGQVYTLDSAKRKSPSTWSLTQTLDQTPNVKYRRVWTMAEYDGRLFCSTLPSGKIYAAEHGLQASNDSTFPSGWHHVVAVKSHEAVELYVDGQRVSQRLGQLTEPRMPVSMQLTIGNGMNGPYTGELQELRIYQRRLSANEILELAKQRP